MSVKLKKEHLSLSEVVCSRYCQTTVDCDIIVPDIKPDVLKVLRTSGEAVITQKNIQADKVYLQGVIRLDILYIPDGSSLGSVKSISCTQDFSHTVDAKGAKPGMSLVAEAECEGTEFTLVNSRKLNIRSKLGLNIKVSCASEIQIATEIEGEAKVQTDSRHLRICNCCCETERDIMVRERLDVPSGKPDLGEILKLSARPVPGELRLLDNKVIVKGELKVCTLYCGGDEESTVQCMEHSLPFTEILEVDGVTEAMSAEADYCIKDIYGEICRDADGDKRVLSVEITLTACIRATEIIECDAICDAYGLDSELILEKNPCTVEQLIETSRTQLTQKESVCVPDYLPDIHQVCDCTGTPNIESISAQEDCVTVSGYLSCNILYMTADRDTPISGFSHVLPFSHTFEIPGVTESTICDAKADLEHMAYTISSPRDLELRSIILLNLKAMSPGSCQLVSEITYNTEAAPPQLPQMVVYFVQKGDTLWSIAKHYRITPDEILAANGSEKEFLKPGNKIYIFR